MREAEMDPNIEIILLKQNGDEIGFGFLKQESDSSEGNS